MTTFLGGLAGIAAVRAIGRPHPVFQAGTAFELVAAPLLLVARGTAELPAPGADPGGR